ncbi:hypothetical protein ColTof4_04330 [Colletotrichum tofieldiae]|nr:hypothetical protein ColTof4_04330 [Colletotrichum tofieldiae]
MASKSKTKDGNDSRYVSRQPHSNDTPPHTPNPIHQVSSVIHSRIRTSSRGSGESGRSAPFSGLLRRSHPRPAPIEVSQLTHETPPPTGTVESSPPPLPTPLLAGCPGREISGAKSDGRGLTCDFEEPPVLDCPDDLSKTEFHEHPLAHHIELEKGWEKHQLALYGLILPAKVDNGTPTYTWESDPEEQEEADLNMVSMLTEAKTPAKPPTPTERPRTPSNILHKVKSFANFIATSDLEKDMPELPTLKELLDQFGLPPATLIESAPRTFLRPTRSSGSLRPKTPLRTVPSATKLRIKRSTGVDKAQISDPVAPEEMRRVGLDLSQAVVQRKGTADNERISTYATSLRNHSNLISPSMSSNLPFYLLQPQHPTVYFGNNEAPPKFRLAPPRLSPMEYARQYLIAKAKADKEDGGCTVCKPTLIWTWTEGYKEFLLLPRIPKGVQRSFLLDDDKDWKRSDFLKSGFTINNNDAKSRSFTPLPLDLAPSSPLLPARFFGDSHSPTLSTHSRGMSVDSFILDRPLATENKSLHKSAKSPFTGLSASPTNESTGFFVAVHTNSESEFTRSLPFQPTPSSSFRKDPGTKRHHLTAYDRAASATPSQNTFTATLANLRVSEQSPQDTNRTAGVPTNAAVTRLYSAASSQQPITAPSTPANAEEALQSFAAPLAETTNDRHRQSAAVIPMSRPDSALSYRTVIGPNSPILTVERDENNVSPSNADYDGFPPAPVSPLSSSPLSAQTKFVAPPQVTRTLDTHNTLDDAQTQQPIDETFLESISEDEVELADTSSVYSQDSVITVVRHPVAERRHTPLNFMSQARTTGENGQEDLAPRQQESLSSNATRSWARTLQHSPILPPLSYIPNTQSAHPHASSEPLQEYNSNIDRRSRAPSSSISTVSTSITGSIAEQRDRSSTASEASAGSQSLTSVSTSTSRRSQTPIPDSSPLPGRSSTRKHVRSSRIEGSSPKAPSNNSHPSNNISRLPALASVAESPSPSPGICLSTTSPAVNPTDLSRQKPLPRRPDSIQKDAVTKAIESRYTDLPPLQVRRGRAVNSLDYIPASQIYPKPLKISAMKSPSPATTTPPGSRFASGASTDTVVRSASRLIKDVNAEVHREMEEVLSPRTAALVAASKSAEEREDIDTPTHRPLRKLRSLPKPVPWSSPIHPPPNKPLPPIPQNKKKAPSDAPPCTSVDTNYDSGPAISHNPTIAQAPAPPHSSPSVTTFTPDFYNPYPPPKVIWTNGDVTVADFSIPKRAVRPATSMVAFSPYPPTLMDQRQQIRRPESAANLQRLAPAGAPSQARLLGKVVSLAELKQRREAGFSDGSGSDEAIGLTTFLREDISAAPASAKERAEKNGKNDKPEKLEKLEKPDKSNAGSKKKLFGKLFRRNRKDGEK